MANEVKLIGNVGTEPIISETATEVYAKFKMATDFTFTNSQGLKLKHTEWHLISAKNSLVEKVKKNVHKGAFILVEGSIFTEKWKDKKTNEERSQKVIRASKIMLLRRTEISLAQSDGSDGESTKDNPA